MKHTYRFHRDTYAIGENEQLYENMAKKGWKLVKRGAYLSKFEKMEPEARRYRIELSVPGFLEDPEMPDEQVALYEDCGWEFVTNHGLVHVFTAPDGSDAVEFYTDPRQQADTLKALRHQYRNSWIVVAVMLGINLLLTLSMARDPELLWPQTWASIVLAWVRSTQLVLAYILLFVRCWYQYGYGAIRTMILHHHLKKGKPLDHTPKKRYVYFTCVTILTVAELLSLFCLGIQLIQYEKTYVPYSTNEPYLLMGEDLGIHEERVNLYGRKNQLEKVSSFAAENIWMLNEATEDTWLYQNIYQVRSKEMIPELVDALMYKSTFARTPEHFQALAVEGLDAAYDGGLDGIAVKADLVYYFTYSEQCDEAFFYALADKLAP